MSQQKENIYLHIAIMIVLLNFLNLDYLRCHDCDINHFGSVTLNFRKHRKSYPNDYLYLGTD